MKRASRKNATYINLGFQYSMMVLMIVRGLIIPPLAAFYIDLDLLGAWFASGNIVQWLMLSEGGAWLYLRQRVALEYGRGNYDGIAKAIGSGGIILLTIGAAITVVGLYISSYIPGWMNVEVIFYDELILAFTLTVIGLGMAPLAALPRAVSQGFQKQILVNANLLVSELTSLTVIIVLIINDYGVIALGIGPLVREVIQNLLNYTALLILLKKTSIRPAFSQQYIRGMAGNMGWAFLNNLSVVMRRNVDALIVSQVFGNSSVLIVEWTKRAWEIFYLIITKASGSFTPAFSHVYGEGDVDKFRGFSVKLFSVIGLCLSVVLAFGLLFNESFVAVWVGEQFYAGDAFNIAFGIATLASAVSFTLLELLFATGKIKGPAIVQVLQGLVRLVLLYIMIPYMGVLSIPVSMFVADIFIGIVYMEFKLASAISISISELNRYGKYIIRDIVVVLLLIMIWPYGKEISNWSELVQHGLLFGTSLFIVLFLSNQFLRQLVITLFRKMIRVNNA